MLNIYHVCNFFAILLRVEINKNYRMMFFWKMARNNDEIWNCSEALNMDQNIECTEVDLENHITVYLDFNVYQRYESDDKVKEFLKLLYNRITLI